MNILEITKDSKSELFLTILKALYAYHWELPYSHALNVNTGRSFSVIRHGRLSWRASANKLRSGKQSRENNRRRHRGASTCQEDSIKSPKSSFSKNKK